MKKIYIFLTMVVLVVGSGVFGINVAADNAEENVKVPELYIKAINPGFKEDGKNNVGEMIEIGRVGNVGDDFSLAGVSIGYTDSSGEESIIVTFSEYFLMTGETFLLRLASSPNSELANLTYTKTLAMDQGPLNIWRNGEVIDTVCWTGKDGCLSKFDKNRQKVLVRNMETGEFEARMEYEPEYNAVALVDLGKNGDEGSADDSSGTGVVSKCRGLIFSEILSYYEETKDEQFVEFYNSRAEQMRVDGCYLRYKNKTYPLEGMVGAEGYLVRRATDFALTKNPTSSNLLELLDADFTVIDTLEYPNGQRKGAAYALIGYDADGLGIWKVTYAPTPGEPNNYQEFKSCAEGKVINEATGNCVKVTTVAEKICGEGQYLNLLTGRCKKYDTESGTTECKEGYYLYEPTGRCRKIVENDGAEYAIVPETYEESTSFVAVYAILGVLGVGVVYAIWEFRIDLLKLWHKVFR